MEDLKARLDALEAEVRVLRDHEEIRQLLASYGPLADNANTPASRSKVGALFAAEGTYDLGSDWKATGPDEIGELLNNEDHLALVANGSAHVMGMPLIQVTGDTARAISYSRVYRHEAGVFSIWRVSANLWECRRENNAWKIQRRTNRLLNGSADALALLTTLND